MTNERTKFFSEPAPRSRETAMARLETRDPEVVAGTIVAVALHEEDYDFVAKILVDEAASEDRWIRGAAIIGIGHMARCHGRVPDAAVQIVGAALDDPDEHVRGQADAAADDIAVFLPHLASRLGRSTSDGMLDHPSRDGGRMRGDVDR